MLEEDCHRDFSENCILLIQSCVSYPPVTGKPEAKILLRIPLVTGEKKQQHAAT